MVRARERDLSAGFRVWWTAAAAGTTLAEWTSFMKQTGLPHWLLRACLLAGCGLAACSGGSDTPSRGRAADGGFGNINDPGGTGGSSGPGTQAPSGMGAGGGGGMSLPPETEERRDFETPRAGARFVYVANPRRDSVAIIDSTGLAIRTVQVGDTPTYLATAPQKDVALVLNVGTRDVNVLRTDAATGTTRVSPRIPVVPGANRISVAPDGRHAVVWYDSSLRGTADRTAIGSFQDVSLLALGAADGEDRAIALTVGFRPSDVVFSSDGTAAFVVTEDGISVIRFAEVKSPMVAPLVRLGSAGPGMAPPRDVSVTPDGRYALARREGASEVLLADLTGANELRVLDLGSHVSDLDLAASGAFAVAVLRAESAYVRLPIPAAFAPGAVQDRRILSGETVGSASLSPDGKRAILYTTAVSPPVERVVIVDLEGTAPPLPVRLKKGVRAVALAPDGRSALVVNTKDPGNPADPGIDVETEIDRSYGYTLVDMQTGFAKLQRTDADVWALAATPDASRAFVVIRAPGPQTAVRLVQRVTLASFIVDDFVLGSPPLSVAVLSQDVKRAFVSQEHPEGRISFIHWETGAVESVTGFELNGRIVQ